MESQDEAEEVPSNGIYCGQRETLLEMHCAPENGAENGFPFSNEIPVPLELALPCVPVSIIIPYPVTQSSKGRDQSSA